MQYQEMIALAQCYSAGSLGRLDYLKDNAKAETVQVMACVAILDRAYGRPNQAVAVTHSQAPVLPVGIDEVEDIGQLRDMLRVALAKAQAGDGPRVVDVTPSQDPAPAAADLERSGLTLGALGDALKNGTGR